MGTTEAAPTAKLHASGAKFEVAAIPVANAGVAPAAVSPPPVTPAPAAIPTPTGGIGH